jgi:hypothetical protein
MTTPAPIATHTAELMREMREPTDDGWLQAGPLLYRLTDDRKPSNRDEIRVTMANGSHSPESCAARAGELLDAIKQARAADAASQSSDARASQALALVPLSEMHSIVAGALFDFAGFLTTRPTITPFGSAANAAPAVDLLQAWAAQRGLHLDEANVHGWGDGILPAPTEGGAA